MKKLLGAGLDAYLNIGLAIGLAVSIGVFADSLKGDIIWENWAFFRDTSQAGLAGHIVSVLLPLCTAFLCALGLYKRRLDFLPVRHLGLDYDFEPKEVLVFFLSHAYGVEFNDAYNQVVFKRGDKLTTVDLSDDIVEDSLNTELSKQKFSWQQLMYAVGQHLPKLKKVILIGSAHTDQGPGSYQQAADAQAVLQRYLKQKGIQVLIHDTAIDFENTATICDSLKDLVEGQLRDEFSLNDIIIDVTGGQKTASIAAALFTLHNPELQFEYVTTGDKKEIKTYNVVSESNVEVG